MMTLRRFFITTFCCLLIPVIQIQAQERLYLPFFEALNMNPDYQYSVTKLYKTYLDATGRYVVILSERRDTNTMAETLRKARESAEAVNATYFVMGEMNRVGEVVVISLSMHNTSDGEKVWSRLVKAESPEDLDPIMEKLANITGTDGELSKEEDIYNVTQYDARRLRKKRSVENLGFTIGGAFPVISDEFDEELAGGLGIVWSFDAGNLIFDLKAETYINSVNSIIYGDIDINYPFGAKSTVPFALAGIGYGGMAAEIAESNSASTKNVSGGGLMGFLGGGLIINRTSSVRLRLTLKGFYSAYDLADDLNPAQPFGGIFGVTVLFDR